MDAEQFRAVYERLKNLHENSTYKVRPRTGMHRPSLEELDVRHRELAGYTVELMEIVDELMQAIAARPSK